MLNKLKHLLFRKVTKSCLHLKHRVEVNWARIKINNDNLILYLGKETKQLISQYALSPDDGISSVQSLNRIQLFAAAWISAHQASLSITNSRSSPKLMCIESVMPSSHLILCRPLLLLPPIPPSIRVFSNESTILMRWPKYWSFSLSISPSNEHPGLVSFRMDWLDLLAVQGTCKMMGYNSIKTYYNVHVVTTLLTLCSINYPNPTRIKNILLVTSLDFKTSWNFKNQIVYTSNPQTESKLRIA